MRRAALAASALALLAAGLSTATGAAPKSAAATSTTIPGPNTLVLKNGGTVTVAVQSLPAEFNPWTATGSSSITSMVMQQVWPQPFVVNSQMQAVLANDTSGLPGSGLLTAEVVGVDPQTVVYLINPKATWSDGVPITAADFRYDWIHQLAYGARLPALEPLAGYKDIASIVGTNGGKTMTVTFKQPYADWQGLFTDLVPAHVAAQYGWVAAFNGFDPKKVISGGPFMITRVIPGRELILGRNPAYWGHQPLLNRIIFRVVHSDAEALRGLASGHIDVAQLMPSPSVDVVAAAHDLNEQGALTPTLWQLAMNVSDPVLSDPLVREAVAAAIDRNQLVTNTVGLLTSFGQTAGNRVYAAGAPGSQGNDGAFGSVNLTEADSLLAQAGYPMSSSGDVLSPSGKPLALQLIGPAGNPLIARIEAELSSQLLQAGITVSVTNVPQARLLSDLLPTGRYQLALVPYLVSAYPSTASALYTKPVGPTPIAPTDAATTTTALSPVVPKAPALIVTGDETEPGATVTGAVSRNVLGYDDPEVDSLFASASAQLNASAASSLYNKIDIRLWLDLPTLPLFQMPAELVTRVDLVNVSSTQTEVGPLWDAQDWAIQLSPLPTTTTTPGG
ncbi:MAG: ABC-type transporter, substrate-binding lipoprotein family 5 [Acidimicrobiaceae bacterium]|nr:ABC-type transporter, substrate-binding lipoprotein family 5 [Acidimicrobiaceae bacterium]